MTPIKVTPAAAKVALPAAIPLKLYPSCERGLRRRCSRSGRARTTDFQRPKIQQNQVVIIANVFRQSATIRWGRKGNFDITSGWQRGNTVRLSAVDSDEHILNRLAAGGHVFPAQLRQQSRLRLSQVGVDNYSLYVSSYKSPCRTITTK